MHDLELDHDTKSKIVHAVGKTLGLDVNILCMVKMQFANEKDKHVPLGSVLIVPLLKRRHLFKWIWCKGKARKAAREVTPTDRQVFVVPMSAEAYEQLPSW